MITPIDKLMDAQYIKRWAIVGTATENNLAAHSFNVAMLAMEIYNRIPSARMMYAESLVCYFALIHDIGEVYTGDIPTPTKMKMQKAGFDINTFDSDVAMEKRPPEAIRKIIKAADLIDNYVFIHDNAVGSRGKAAQKEVLGRLMDYAGRADPVLGKAMLDVYSYVIGRLSDVIEEGKRAASYDKEAPEGQQGSQDGNIVGGEPLDVAGDSGHQLLLSWD